MLNASDFDYIAKLIKDESGITLEKGKEYLVSTRVEPLAKSLGFSDIASFIVQVRQASDLTKRRQLIEALTTHETSFYRDHEPFEVMRLKVLPEIIERQRTKKELTIWSGAASSGQEPYSVCMLLKEYFPELSGWKVNYVATDISRAILERCESGKYNQIEVNRGLPIRFLAKYFEKVGTDWIVKPEIRSMVKFKEMNLLKPFIGINACDLVLLRNVLIYFDIPTKREILDRVRKILKPEGLLFLGTAETTLNLSEDFERVAFDKTSCYRQKAK